MLHYADGTYANQLTICCTRHLKFFYHSCAIVPEQRNLILQSWIGGGFLIRYRFFKNIAVSVRFSLLFHFAIVSEKSMPLGLYIFN